MFRSAFSLMLSTALCGCASGAAQTPSAPDARHATATALVADAPSDPVVETASAYYFLANSDTNVVYYFPKLETRLYPSTPIVPGVPRYRAAVVLKTRDESSAEQVKPAWKGKILSPYNIRLDSDCEFHASSPMRSVQQTLSALYRDVSGAEQTPLCEFLFRLPSAHLDENLAKIQAQADSGALIDYTFTLHVRTVAAWPWSPLLAAVRSSAEQLPPAPWSRADAQALLLGAAAQDIDLQDALNPLSSWDLDSFVDQALTTLFTESSAGYAVTDADVSGDFYLNSEEDHDL
jgi:hypothetical protein